MLYNREGREGSAMRRGAAQEDPYDDFGGADPLGTEATQVLLQRAEETGS